jgi:hypothetical protein
MKASKEAAMSLPSWLGYAPARSVNWRSQSIKARVGQNRDSSWTDVESTLELDYVEIIEWQPEVSAYFAQPITLVGKDYTGIERTYTPDFLLMYTPKPLSVETVRYVLVEVKPASELKRHWAELRPRFEVAVKWCREHDVRFQIVTDRWIRAPRLANARFLNRYPYRGAVPLYEIFMVDQLQKHMKQVGESTPGDLVRALTGVPERQLQYIPFVWQLLNSRYLLFDNTQKLTMASRIWINTE